MARLEAVEPHTVIFIAIAGLTVCRSFTRWRHPKKLYLFFLL